MVPWLMLAVLLGRGFCADEPPGRPPIRASFFGEDPERAYESDPESTNAQEAMMRDQSQRAAQAEAQAAPAASSVRPAPTAPPAYSKAVLPRLFPVPRVWPGPRRKAEAPEASLRDSVSSAQSKAAAAAPAEAYSLWRGLNAPLLLPASRASDVSMEDARASGREDYERHLLGGAESDPVSAASVGLAAEAGSRKIRVSVELDVAGKQGNTRRALEELARRTGLEPDPVRPVLNAQGTLATVRGWLPSNRYRDLLSFDKIRRVEAQRYPGSLNTDGDQEPRADILIGMRILPGQAPRQALEEPVGRMALLSGFSLLRLIGTQRIPDTDQTVLVIEGRVPVREIGRILADPAVVKLMPSPRPSAVLLASAGPGAHDPAGFLNFMMARHPGLLLTAALSFLSLARLRRRVPKKKRR